MTNKKPSRQKDKKKKKNSGITGFSTLNQVAGVPKPSEHHSSIPVDTPKRIREPQPVCSYCGKEIENIAEAFTASDGSYVHFDCVISRIKEAERPKEDETVSYIGSGNFALIGKDEEGRYKIIKTIPFETPDKTKAMKEYIESLKEL